MMRWTYPLTPDNFCLDGERYNFQSHNIYKASNVQLDRSVKLNESVVIGTGSSVGANTRINHSIIGRNCTIGVNVTLNGAYILDNVIIEDGCTVERSIVGSDSQLFQNVILSSGCILDSAVAIGPNVTLAANTMVASHRKGDEYSEAESSDEDDNFDVELLGADAIGYLYKAEVEDDEIDFRNVQRGFIDYESPAEYTELDVGSDHDSDFDGSDDDSEDDTGLHY
jgi:translation initiation factor eIF-2B subunit epsilon